MLKPKAAHERALKRMQRGIDPGGATCNREERCGPSRDES